VCYYTLVRISIGTRVRTQNISGTNGYGYATICMIDSLRALGHEVNDNDEKADVEIWFDQPEHWNFSKGPYKIGYHPWESTKLQPGWSEVMNQCDEIWTPSPLIASWYRDFNNITLPIFVYEHGIEHEWAPVKREPTTHVKFLHVGAEASRKGGWESVRLFRKAFSGATYRDDVRLTLKMVNSSWVAQMRELGKVRYIDEKYSIQEMLQLFYHHDVYIYPSRGEGFGLTPLQALATGMPTITVPDWAPYSQYLDPRLNLRSRLTTTNWTDIHPGNMFEPNEDDIVDRLRWVVENYDSARDFACENAFKVHEHYDWKDLTKNMFDDLEQRLGRVS
jgi:glycosyltransferase involved in cell wall biosynthesis